MTRWTSAASSPRLRPAAQALRRPFLHWALRTLGVAALDCAASGTQAQEQIRPFPPAALRGKLHVDTPPVVVLDGHPDQLSPGARIRDTQNHLVTSATLAGQDLLVNYTREQGGQINEVWVLTAAEAAVSRPWAAKPSLLDQLFGS